MRIRGFYVRTGILMRKLSVPIEEIRLLQKGEISFSQTISGQIERLEKEIQNARVT